MHSQTTVKTMQAIQKPAPEAGFKHVQIPTPTPGDDDVLIKVSLASICGTDLHITEWDAWSASRMTPPMTYGHEFCGIVDTVGKNVSQFKPGDYVSAEMHLVCNACEMCQTGHGHICQNVKIFGVDLDGCYADYINLPQTQVIKIPDSIPPEHGACLDSLGNAVHAVSRGNVSGKTVHVIGCGPVGLFAIRAAFAMGASRVYASDVVPFRLNMGKTAGATEVFDASNTDIPAKIKAATKGKGVDVVLEMSGNPHAIQGGFQGLKLGGTIILFGITPAPVEINLNQDIIFKEAKVLGVNGREIFKTWHQMLELLDSGKLDIDFVITHHLPLSDFGEAIRLVASGETGKVLLKP